MALASSGLPALAVTVMIGAFGSRVVAKEPATASGLACVPSSSTMVCPTARVWNSGRKNWALEYWPCVEAIGSVPAPAAPRANPSALA